MTVVVPNGASSLLPTLAPSLVGGTPHPMPLLNPLPLSQLAPSLSPAHGTGSQLRSRQRTCPRQASAAGGAGGHPILTNR